MRLTERHVRLVHRDIAPQTEGPMPGTRPTTDAEYLETTARLVGEAEDPRLFWIFAFGSLIWKPACEVVEIRTAVVRGWHRAFCLGWNTRFRGSAERPGLILALDRGGACKGVLYRLPPEAVGPNLDKLLRREMLYQPVAFPPRWVTAHSPEGTVRALTFVIDRNSGRYVSGLTDEQLAEVLAHAVGSRGSMAEYLFSTVAHLEQLGIHDPHLWRLQELVADRIEAAYPDH
jgi:cation transport protein ChaC